MPRLLRPEVLPSTLWDTPTLQIAPLLAAAYLDQLTALGLLEKAKQHEDRNAPIGGTSEADTHEHFAHAFDGSCARSSLPLLDPLDDLQGISDVVVQSVSSGKLAILDVPAGAGAFSFAMLSAVAELRRVSVLPRHPLEVQILAGELSPSARTLCEALLKRLAPKWEAQAIHVSLETMEWDVYDQGSNTRLLQKFIVMASQAERTLLVVCNFSGVLKHGNNRKRALPQLNELLRFASGKRWSSALWIEPQTNAAKNELFPWLAKLADGVRDVLGLKKKDEVLDDAVHETDCAFRLPCVPTCEARARLSVKHVDLGRGATS